MKMKHTTTLCDYCGRYAEVLIGDRAFCPLCHLFYGQKELSYDGSTQSWEVYRTIQRNAPQLGVLTQPKP